MSLPAPNLDDRTFDEIVQDALRRIPRHCPGWTDHNPSDPGITVIELMAWMTESVIYRLNRVPEKSYIKFLELLGVALRPMQPARAWIVIQVAQGASESELPTIPAGSRVSTSGGGEPIVFETIEPINLTSAAISRVITRYGERFADRTEALLGGTPVVLGAFPEHAPVPHLFYLGGERLGNVGPRNRFLLHAHPVIESSSGINVEWECWNGEEWEIVLPADDETRGFSRPGSIVFDSIPDMETASIAGIETFWIRARLLSVAAAAIPQLDSLKGSMQFKPGYSLHPEAAFTTADGTQFLPLDFSLTVYPFAHNPDPGKKDVLPVAGTTTYIGSELFSDSGSRITVDVRMSEQFTPAPESSVRDLELRWEYYSRTGSWKLLGTSTVQGADRGEHDFSDGTRAMTGSGVIGFVVPEDVDRLSVQGVETYWVRIRLARGGYGNRQENAPYVDRLSLSLSQSPRDFDHYLSYNYFGFEDVSPGATSGDAFSLFDVREEEEPILYLCLDQAPSQKLHRMYFRLSRDLEEPLPLVWEYYGSDRGWRDLRIRRDRTEGFLHSGAVEFIPPPDWDEAEFYERRGHWLRVRWQGAGELIAPSLQEIRLNAAEVEGAITIERETLGSSSGKPGQEFMFSNAPILPDPVVFVREVDNPSGEKVRELRDELGEDLSIDEDRDSRRVRALWVRWRAVDSFAESRPDSRHYTVDPFAASISFGDGQRGMIPPIGGNNIRCERYRLCYGSRGNVGSGQITNLETSYASIDRVWNPEPAGGGADAEKVEEAKVRGPWTVKHRYRAVTLEDFERLAIEASGEVAKVVCRAESSGRIIVTVIPRGTAHRLKPSVMLVRRVREYLDDRRLVTTRLHVTGPDYVNVTLRAVVVPTTVVSDIPALRSRLESELRSFVHPLHGGPDHSGWPMGRPVHLSEIYYLLERVSGVDHISRLELNGSPWEQRVEMGAQSYPYWSSLEIDITDG